MTTTHEPAERHSIQLEVPPEPVSIAIVRSAVRRVVTFRDDDASSSFLIALTEILSNAIDEHDRIGSDSAVVVTIESGLRDVVTVSDVGEGFDPTGYTSMAMPAAPRDAEVRERGRGIALAQAFVPLLSLRTGPAGTHAILPLDGLGIVR